MAAFLQDHGAGFLFPGPVPPHKAMGLMPVLYIFNGLDRHDFTYSARIQQALEFPVEGRIAQHMADCHKALVFLGQPGDLCTFTVIRGDRLFQQQMIPLFNGRRSLCVMLAVLHVVCPVL